MLYFYILLIAIILTCLSYKRYNQDYITIEQSNNIKGIFIWLVFIGHIIPYMTKISPFQTFIDKSALRIVGLLLQLVVVPFMFYSGYGVMNSIKNKGLLYVSEIPRKRVLTTMLNFMVAVTCFVILNFALGVPMDIKQILLSLSSWDSVGNSNWYIFTICFCYLSSYVSYKICGYSKCYLVVNLSVLLTFVIILSRFKPSWWYDTCLAYVAGSAFCYYKDKIETAIKNRYALHFLLWGGLFATCYVLALKAPSANALFMNMCGIAFSMLVVMFTMKFRLKSRVLEWSGKHLFPLYIYQRFPMILFSTICGGVIVAEHKYLYVAACATVAIIIAWLYKYINIKVQ